MRYVTPRHPKRKSKSSSKQKTAFCRLPGSGLMANGLLMGHGQARRPGQALLGHTGCHSVSVNMRFCASPRHGSSGLPPLRTRFTAERRTEEAATFFRLPTNRSQRQKAKPKKRRPSPELAGGDESIKGLFAYLLLVGGCANISSHHGMTVLGDSRRDPITSYHSHPYSPWGSRGTMERA
jgi:hypothetical protein